MIFLLCTTSNDSSVVSRFWLTTIQILSFVFSLIGLCHSLTSVPSLLQYPSSTLLIFTGFVGRTSAVGLTVIDLDELFVEEGNRYVRTSGVNAASKHVLINSQQGREGFFWRGGSILVIGVGFAQLRNLSSMVTDP